MHVYAYIVQCFYTSAEALHTVKYRAATFDIIGSYNLALHSTDSTYTYVCTVYRRHTVVIRPLHSDNIR